jgi:hypothetical protein
LKLCDDDTASSSVIPSSDSTLSAGLESIEHMNRAVLYARVSSDAQQKEGTIESQVAELNRQIAAAGHVILIETLRSSGTSKTNTCGAICSRSNEIISTQLSERQHAHIVVARLPSGTLLPIRSFLPRDGWLNWRFRCAGSECPYCSCSSHFPLLRKKLHNKSNSISVAACFATQPSSLCAS